MRHRTALSAVINTYLRTVTQKREAFSGTDKCQLVKESEVGMYDSSGCIAQENSIKNSWTLKHRFILQRFDFILFLTLFLNVK